jgi:phage baseplate assembly protein W
MDAPFLGVGWGFPVAFTGGAPVMVRGDEGVAESIWIILSTAPGERVMRPEFGCGIHQHVFALNNATTMGLIAFEVRRALVRWEPRIDVLDVRVTADVEDDRLLVDLDYAVRPTNSRFNLVFPFYLEGGGA